MNATIQRFELEGADGQPLRVALHRPHESDEKLPLTVICHGFKGFMDWGFFPHLAERIAASGRAALRFNFSHNGIGQRPLEFDRLDLFERNTWSREIEDLAQVVTSIRAGQEAWTEGLDERRMALVGHSRGGGIAILQAARAQGWRGVATLAATATTDRFGPREKEILEREGRILIPNARTGQDMPVGRCLEEDRLAHLEALDIGAAAAALACPLLLIHGTADTSVPFEEAEALHRARPSARLEALEGADHVFGSGHPFAGETPLLAEAIRRLLAFLSSCDA